MALATKCPHCNTIFRVAADQLKLRGGIVRCGSCHEVFDGNAALVEPAAKPTPVIPEIPVDAPHPPELLDAPEYEQGAPVDFELDFVDAAPDAAPADATEPAAPAVWRTTAPASPEDVAEAVVARAFAAVTESAAPATEAVPEPEPQPDVQPLPWEDTPATADDEPAADASPPSDFVPAFLRAAPAKTEAEDEEDELPPAEHPDGRIEPTLDTPQEHIVAASLDDAHHFEDLPPDEQPAPADEPWSMAAPEAERDETALHAVAAVNTDVPDDGESLPDEEPVEEPASTRRERALKRARARSEAASAPAGEAGEADEATAERLAAEARMRALAGVDEFAAADLDHSDLGFVKRHDRSQKYGKAMKVAMAAGIPLLLAGLLLQAATTFRDTLAASYPQLKPALAAICEPLGCKIGLPTQLDALSVEQGELASMAENTFSYTTMLRNQSKTVQAWPHVELTLNDNADKPVLRRVFAPREYLPAAAEADKGFGPRSEQSIKLYFELKELKASGYHIAIFYP